MVHGATADHVRLRRGYKETRASPASKHLHTRMAVQIEKLLDELKPEILEREQEGAIQDDLASFKDNADIDANLTPHLLFLGRGGSGKTALGNVLINGKSSGTPGPAIGTRKYIESTEVMKDGKRYIICDTRGIGDSTTNEKEMEEEIKAFYTAHQKECMVIICVRMNDRVTDNGIKQCFKVCKSLGPDVWNNVIVAVTHSEIPLEMRNDDNGLSKTEGVMRRWREGVQEMVRSLKVDIDIPVCFTSHTAAERPIMDNWKNELLRAIATRAKESEGCFAFLFESLLNMLKSYEKSHTSMQAALENTPPDENTPTENIKAKLALGTLTGGLLGGVGGGGITAGTIAIVAAFGGATIATSGVGALIGAGVGVAIAVILVWLWIRRRKKQNS